MCRMTTAHPSAARPPPTPSSSTCMQGSSGPNFKGFEQGHAHMRLGRMPLPAHWVVFSQRGGLRLRGGGPMQADTGFT